MVFIVVRSGLTWLCEMFNAQLNTQCIKKSLSQEDTPKMKGKYNFKPKRRHLNLFLPNIKYNKYKQAKRSDIKRK